MPYISQDILRHYIEDRLISEQSHPEAPYLRIYNYTRRTTYGGAWDDVTMQCRGLILDVEKECVVAACLKKFFNYGEHIQKGGTFPNSMPVVYEKLDGWYGSLYWLNGHAWIATRGSFTSPGAQWATEWFRQQWSCFTLPQQLELLRGDVTHLFEIIAPCTRIVVEYPYEGLVHIATLERQTGKDVEMGALGIRKPEIILNADYQTLREMDHENAEGFVCHWPDAGLRLKIKFEKYLELHVLYMHTSAYMLWKQLYDGQVDLRDMFRAMPHDLKQWAIVRWKQLIEDKRANEQGIEVAYRNIMYGLDRTWGKDKTARDKAIAMAIQAHPLRGLLMLYHRYQDALWKAVEPVGSETFRVEGEDI